jgi:selenocysteine-specific elongation factor
MLHVVATAGHIDHGKSTLVQCLTGTHPDRLAEEKARGMTIDLGFAFWSLPNGEQIGIVDVPGHHDFIGNMLAGVGGVSAVMLVVAADEGLMPQTLEHLAILDLLGVSRGVVALTKSDLADADWLALVQQDIAAALAGTTLAAARVIPVSAHTGAGIDVLTHAIMDILAESTPALLDGRPRLPVDRVFTLSGFGTVVTGTLLGGNLSVDDRVALFPDGPAGRIRGIQRHQHTVAVATPGGRTAVNLSGIEKADVRRGMVLGLPGQWQPTSRLTVRLRCLPGSRHALRSGMRVKVFLYADEVSASIRLLESTILEAGESAWAQIELERPVVAARGDRFVIRLPSPEVTLGGGIIAEAEQVRRHRRNQPALVARLTTLLEGDPAEKLVHAAQQKAPVPLEVLRRLSGLDAPAFSSALAAAHQDGSIVEIEPGQWISRAAITVLITRAEEILSAWHRDNPLSAGLPREELRQQLGVSSSYFRALMGLDHGARFRIGASVALAHHEITLTPDQQRRADGILMAVGAAPFTPPAPAELAQAWGDDVLGALIERGDLVRVSHDVLFDAHTFSQMTHQLLEAIGASGGLTTAQARDLFGTSRKYIIALLEHMDAAGLTRRAGDVRVLGHQAARA